MKDPIKKNSEEKRKKGRFLRKKAENKNHEAIKLDMGNVLILPVAMFFISLILGLYNPPAGALSLGVAVFAYFHCYQMEKLSHSRAMEAVEALDKNFDEITKSAIFNMPFPMAVVNEEGLFLWYNSYFKELFEIESTALGQSYNQYFGDLSFDDWKEKDSLPLAMNISEKDYIFYHNMTDGNPGSRLLLIYGLDRSLEVSLEKECRDKQLAVCSVFFDNYDEVRSRVSEQDRPLISAKVDRKINAYAGKYNAFMIKYESERYVMIMDRKKLEEMQKDHFEITENIKKIRGVSIAPTLSLGISYGNGDPGQIWDDSKQALDIALSRGGDQVVIKCGEDLNYFGGKNQATQRFTKVKARVMSNTIKSFIINSDKVFIMGHRNGDMDSLGSSLGMAFFAKTVGGSPFIVLDEVTPAIENLYNGVMKDLEGANDLIISPEAALARRTKESLVIVVDNHRHDSTCCPELLDMGNRIIIVDHHRRGSDYIKEAEISYIEPYSSSASELVTEMFSYLEGSPIMPKVVAEALLAGIMVDTKEFNYQTGARTFEAAAFLKNRGADSMVIKQLFQDDLILTQYRSEIIANAKKCEHNTMIGRFEKDIEGSSLVASQAADELLGIRGIEASFVLTYTDGRVHISARSLGDISVQLIMERLGGGGHLTAAATQMDENMDRAEDLLKKAIHEYFLEEVADNESNTD